ncbi:hypothetical protein [Desulfatibacillum aliphaticivorans]|uniref:hypothetical protein n=1 Tax=Desulfatibacillum aliphaticivorans TaxID=218208 RepID=UPI0010A47F31|nr:hypothetical protein [Desulfatibacillum aliphaticivorans]
MQKLDVVGGRTNPLEFMFLFGFGKGFRPQEIDGFHHAKGRSNCADAPMQDTALPGPIIGCGPDRHPGKGSNNKANNKKKAREGLLESSPPRAFHF